MRRSCRAWWRRVDAVDARPAPVTNTTSAQFGSVCKSARAGRFRERCARSVPRGEKRCVASVDSFRVGALGHEFSQFVQVIRQSSVYDRTVLRRWRFGAIHSVPNLQARDCGDGGAAVDLASPFRPGLR